MTNNLKIKKKSYVSCKNQLRVKMESFEYLEETAVYLDSIRKQRTLGELYHNAERTIKRVGIFEFFDEYVLQLSSSQNEDKKKVYWDVSYYEKLIDYVKISIAFENYNKAILLDKGYVVHSLGRQGVLAKLGLRQHSGEPIQVKNLLEMAPVEKDLRSKKYYLGGFKKNYMTLNYSMTLSEKYQEIIGLDAELLYWLKRINEKRNRETYVLSPIPQASSSTHLMHNSRRRKQEASISESI